MLKRLLSLAVVVEAELVHRIVGHSPSMRNVPLLKALRDNAAKPRDIGAGQFKKREGLHVTIVVEIVVDTEVLLLRELVINLYRELIASNGLGWNGLNCIATVRRRGHELQYVNRCRIHTSQRYLTIWEQSSVGSPCGYSCRKAYSLITSLAAVEKPRIGKHWVGVNPRGVEKIGEWLRGAGALLSTGKSDYWRGYALTDAP